MKTEFDSNRVEEDLRLASACAEGKAQAWQDFLTEHGPTIYGAARQTLVRVLGRANQADAEDIFQSVIFALFSKRGRKFRTFEGRSSLKAWLRVVTSRIALNYIRTEKAVQNLRFASVQSGSDGTPSQDPVDPNWIHQFLSVLQPIQRVAIKMHLLEGLSYQAIAKVLGLPINTVASHIHRAKKKLTHT